MTRTAQAPPESFAAGETEAQRQECSSLAEGVSLSPAPHRTHRGVKVMSSPLPPACRRDQGTPCPARGAQTHSIPAGPCTASPPGPPHIPARDPAIPPPIPTRAKTPRSPISHGGGGGGGSRASTVPSRVAPGKAPQGPALTWAGWRGPRGARGGGSAGDGGTDGAALRSATQPGSGGGGGAHGRGCAPCLQPPVAMATEGWSRCLQRLQKSAGEDEGGMMDTPPPSLACGSAPTPGCYTAASPPLPTPPGLCRDPRPQHGPPAPVPGARRVLSTHRTGLYGVLRPRQQGWGRRWGAHSLRVGCVWVSGPSGAACHCGAPLGPQTGSFSLRLHCWEALWGT